jgi:putative heme iron utilization protein
MNPESTRLLRRLMWDTRVAALGTLQGGDPAVSMVPFATRVTPEGALIVVHVSSLAAHTQNMAAHPRVSLLLMVPDDPALMPQALPRLTLQGQAQTLRTNDPDHAPAQARYLARFPDAADLFGFADFQLVQITITEARLVAGFARAHTLPPDELIRLLTAD